MGSSTPKFRFGRHVITLQRSNTVREIRDPQSARSVLAAAREQLGESLLADILAGDRLGDAARSEHELAARLLDGTYVAVIHDTVPRLLDAPREAIPLSSLVEGPDPEPPPLSAHSTTWIGVTVVHASGAGYPNATFELTLPDGDRVPVQLDASSSFRLEDIPEPGSCYLRPTGHTYEIDESKRGSSPVHLRGDDRFARVGDGAPLSLRTGGEYRVVVEDEIVFDYEVRIVDEIGEPIPEVPVAITVRDRTYECTTDADGVASVQAPESDAAQAAIADLAALRNLVRPRWEQVRSEDWIEDQTDHTYLECTDPLRSVSVKPQLRQTIVVQPWVVQARVLELLFDTNKTFLLPSALTHLREVVRLYQRRADSKLLIVGHTDASGDADVNDPLSLARAQSVRAFLCDDVDAWLAYYDEGMSDSVRWGDVEDQLMLQSVLAGYDGSPQDPPIVRFQKREGLEPTGTVDEATRRQLVTQYMAADGTSLPPGVDAVVHGCGENYPRPDDDKEPDASADDEMAGDRRVELFFFDAELGVLPEPPGDNSGPGAVEYPEWCRRASETHDFFVRAGTVTVQVLLGALDAEGHPPSDRPERLRLTASDGSYDQIRSYNDAVRISLQHFALEFEHVPVAVPCTARIDFHGQDKFAHILFEDVDVGIPTECGEGDQCQEQPPPVAPPPPEAAEDPSAHEADDDRDDGSVAEFPLL